MTELITTGIGKTINIGDILLSLKQNWFPTIYVVMDGSIPSIPAYSDLDRKTNWYKVCHAKLKVVKISVAARHDDIVGIGRWVYYRKTVSRSGTGDFIHLEDNHLEYFMDKPGIIEFVTNIRNEIIQQR